MKSFHIAKLMGCVLRNNKKTFFQTQTTTSTTNGSSGKKTTCSQSVVHVRENVKFFRKGKDEDEEELKFVSITLNIDILARTHIYFHAVFHFSNWNIKY